MNNFFKYLKAQTIRTIKKYPVIFLFTALMTGCIVILVSAMFSANSSADEKKKVQVAIVGDVTDSYLGIGVTAIQNFDSSQYYVDFITMDKPEAVEKLRKQELLGYIEIPDGLVDSIISGENEHITYMAANSPSTIGPVLMNEVVQMISDLVTEAQNGIYGYMDLVKEYGVAKKARYEAADKMSLKYADLILGRNELYTVEEYGVGEGLSFENYYIAAFLVLIILLWGMTCASLLVKSDLALSRTLKSAGHNTLSMVFGEYLPYFVMMCVNMMLVFVGGYFLAKTTDIQHELLNDLSSWSAGLKMLASIIPAIALITAMQFFVYELAANIITAVLLQLLVVVSMSYVSGFFFPLYSLPQSMQNLAKYLPTHKAFNCIGDALFHTPNMSNNMIVWGYFALFILSAALIRQYKMRSNRYD